MPRPKKVVEPKKTGKTAIEVVDDLGNTMRVYTRSQYGKDMEKLAESFAEKFGYHIK